MSNWHQEETYKSLIQIGLSSLKFVLIANGGAIITILAFLGKIYDPTKTQPNVFWSLSFFIIGVFFGGIAHFSAYMTQLRLFNENKNINQVNDKFIIHHTFWLYFSVALVIMGIVCFAIGALLGANAITK